MTKNLSRALVALVALWAPKAMACTDDGVNFCMTYNSPQPVLISQAAYISCWGWNCTVPANDPNAWIVGPGGAQGTVQRLLANLGGTKYVNVTAQYYEDPGQVHVTNPTSLLKAAPWYDSTRVPGVDACGTNADCDSGLCTNNLCAGTCTDNQDCARTWGCIANRCACATNADCGPGGTCDGLSRCTSPVSCTTNSQCFVPLGCQQ